MHPAYRWLSRSCRFVLAGAVGAVATSATMTLFALLGLRWNLPLLAASALVFSLALRFPLFSRSGPPTTPRPPRQAVEILTAALSALAVAVAGAAAAEAAATSPDLLLFWAPKAQAFAAARTIDAEFLRDPLLDYMHTFYPPLVTNLYAFATQAAGRFAWGAATLTFPLLLAAMAVALPGILRSVAAGPLAGAASALIVSALGFLGNELDMAGNGDMPMLLFETLAMALLIGPAATAPSGQLLIGLLLAGATTAKVEGLPFVLAAVPLFLLIQRRQLRVRSAALSLLLPTALCLGLWFAYGWTRHLFHGYQGYGPAPEIYWNRLPLVLAAVARVFWSAGYALPFLLPLAAFLVSPRKPRLAWALLGTAAALSAFFLFTYLHGNVDPTDWIGWSAGRIFSPVTMLLTLASLAPRAGSAGEARGALQGGSLPPARASSKPFGGRDK